MLLALCAAQGVIISLAQHYRVPGFALLQPITATLIPPMAWVAFQTTAIRGFRLSDGWHLSGPVVAVVCLVLHPGLLNVVIPGLFVAYGAAILWVGLKGADAMPRLRLETGDLPGRIWQVIGASLIASALSDALIIAASMLGAAFLQPWIISIFSSGMLLAVGMLSLSSALTARPVDPDEPPERPISDQDIQIVERLDALVQERRLFLDPDLTLSQLARKMVIPAKQLSGAINRVTGANVSRYINAARIRTAQKMLTQGKSITEAMFESGFNTKSNFNREFLRVAGKSPSDWLADQR
ncbi:helix-turn-helix domain-containing protein [Rhodobacter sp. Har01]|uniref:helix-turn-helix domain-containing protein n=1 Tax=Rhodobacter sp. Har01 TaxID=2883999 RepID=UPI001D06B198|nr:helix-turn-helix domain-containing protein [Rhodobacter sp. Har01]MCB6178916.1 helix-turn-helix domain-containing protein [Rhodobacter sp. Har01]